MKKRTVYSKADRANFVQMWLDAGKPPKTTFAKEHSLTPSMFGRWLQLAGAAPVTPGMTGGIPKSLSSGNGKPKGNGRGKGTRYSDAFKRKVLNDAYGSGTGGRGGEFKSACKRHGLSGSTVGYWRKKRPDLMPGGTSIVPVSASTGPLFETAPGANQAHPNGHSPNGLELEMGGGEQAAAGLFEQSQADAWSELMAQLEPLPPRARLRVLTLIEKIQA